MGMKFNLSLLSIFLVIFLVSCVQSQANQTSLNPSAAETYGLKANDLSGLGEYQQVKIDKRLPYTGEGSLPELKLVLDYYEIFYELKDKSYVTNKIYLFNSGEDAIKYFEAVKKNTAFFDKLTETKSFGEDGFSNLNFPADASNLVFRKGRMISKLTTYKQNPDTWAKIVESRIK